MITDLVFMNGYGVYVWSAFAFTLKRFEENFSTLSEEKYNVAINQEIYKEILKHSGSKI